MAKTPSPLHTRRIPKSVSKPTETAEAAATVAEVAAQAAPAEVADKAARKARPASRSGAAAKARASAGKVEAAAVPAPVSEAAKPAKSHKPKLVRDSFTMPKDEYQVIDALKARGLDLGRHVRKSELLRAGIQALAAMNDRAFLKAVTAVPTLKTGRPKAG